MPDDPTSVDNVLDYNPRPAPDQRTRQAACTALRFLGLLSIVAGSCSAGFLLIIQAAFGGETSPRGPYGLNAMSAADWGIVAVIFLIPAIAGASEIFCAARVRSGSIPATIAALTLVTVQTAITLLVGVFYERARTGPVFEPGCIAISAWIVALALPAISVFLLTRVLHQQHVSR